MLVSLLVPLFPVLPCPLLGPVLAPVPVSDEAVDGVVLAWTVLDPLFPSDCELIESVALV